MGSKWRIWIIMRIIMSFILLTFLVLLSGYSFASNLLDGGQVCLLSAYYMPDSKPVADSNQVEGLPKPAKNGVIFKPLQKLCQEYADFGGARVVIHNASRSEVSIRQVKLNGKPVEEHYVDFLDGKWDDRGVVWYRVRPRVLVPGGCSEVYIRFRRRPSGSKATVAVELSNGGTLRAILNYSDPGFRIDYVTTDNEQRCLYVYARCDKKLVSGRIQALLLDGKLQRNVEIYGADFPGNVALAVIKLDKPLQTGSFHIAQITTRQGQSVAAQFRVLSPFFMRTAFLWEPRSIEETNETGMNFVWKAMSFEQSERLGVYSGNLYGKTVNTGHARMRYAYLYDEPDAHDIHPGYKAKYGAKVAKMGPLYTGMGYAVGLGRNARDMIDSGRITKTEEDLPDVATYVITDGTTRPLNWFVYGQLTDIIATDPYPANYYGADWTSIREHYSMIRQAGAPRPFHACLEAYTNMPYHEKDHPEGLRRSPSGLEFRQMAVQAIGCGAKGINSWFWSKGNGMVGANYLPDIRAEYIRINKLTRYIESELLLGTPIDIVSNDAGLVPAGSWYFLEKGPFALNRHWMKERVWTGALLCGPDTIVIAAANHIPASKTRLEHVEPARNVNITVKLPDFLPQVECFEVSESGLIAYPCHVSNGRAIITLASLESGSIFIFRRSWQSEN